LDNADDVVAAALTEVQLKGMSEAVVAMLEGALVSGEEIEPTKAATARQVVADWYVEHGEPDRALSLYLVISPPDQATPDRALALADLATSVGEDDIATQYRERARQAPQRDVIELMTSAQKHEQDHHFQEAAALYRRIVTDTSTPSEVRAQAHMNLAFCLRVLKQYDEAIQQANRAKKLGKRIDPGFWILLNMRN